MRSWRRLPCRVHSLIAFQPPILGPVWIILSRADTTYLFVYDASPLTGYNVTYHLRFLLQLTGTPLKAAFRVGFGGFNTAGLALILRLAEQSSAMTMVKAMPQE